MHFASCKLCQPGLKVLGLHEMRSRDDHKSLSLFGGDLVNCSRRLNVNACAGDQAMAVVAAMQQQHWTVVRRDADHVDIRTLEMEKLQAQNGGDKELGHVFVR